METSFDDLLEELNSADHRYYLDLIKEVAQETRYWAEEYAEKNNFPKSLCGMCAIASAQLWFKLKQQGLFGELRIWGATGNAWEPGSSHVYLVVHDHVVDITAGQFRGRFKDVPDVYIGHEAEACGKYEFYNDIHQVKTPKELYEYQHRCDWVVAERAKTHEIKF